MIEFIKIRLKLYNFWRHNIIKLMIKILENGVQWACRIVYPLLVKKKKIIKLCWFHLTGLLFP